MQSFLRGKIRIKFLEQNYFLKQSFLRVYEIQILKNSHLMYEMPNICKMVGEMYKCN